MILERNAGEDDTRCSGHHCVREAFLILFAEYRACSHICLGGSDDPFLERCHQGSQIKDLEKCRKEPC